MKISMIAAMSKNRVIGKDNDLPWNLPDDFKYFKETTKNHHIIMGRKNWESLPHRFKPLPNRVNLVITRSKDYQAEGAIVLSSMNEALEVALQNKEEEVFIIGGGEIYRIGLNFSDKIYLTEIDAEIDGHVTFPEFSSKEWIETSRKHHPKDEKHKYSFDFVTYQKQP